jgi:heparinase II/III-like protein
MGLETIFLVLSTCVLAPSPQAGTILEAEQVRDRLEIVVQNPERQNEILYIQQGSYTEGPIRLSPGENRYSFRLQREGQALAERSVDITQYDGQMNQLDYLLAPVIEPWELPNRPALALTPVDIRALIKRHQLEPRASKVLNRLLDEANEQLLSPAYIPEDGGTWAQDYRCPVHGVFLEMVTLHEHQCPVDGVIWTGQVFDQALATFLHQDASHQAWIQSLAFTLTGNPAYGVRLKEILLGYVAKYPGYIQHDWSGAPSSTGGKAFGQTLDEAIWLIELIRASDLVRGTGLLNEAETKSVHEQVIRLGMDVLRGNDLGVMNIQNWHNSAIFLAAMTLGETVYANEVLRGPTGLLEQISLGIDSDGLWYEGSFGYHYFTFRAILPMLQAMHRAGAWIDIQGLESMLLMPLQVSFPDGSLAMLNDGSHQTFADNLRNDYEQALVFFPRSELCGPLVEYGRGTTYESIIYGLVDLPFQDWQDYSAVNFDHSGVAALRSGTPANRSTMVLDYGPHGGFHGHYDKLGLSLWHRQKPILIESGAIGYGTVASEDYYRSTLAHNTVVIDGVDQQESTGRLEDFIRQGQNSWLLVSADQAYTGVSMRRQVLMSEWGHAVDGMYVESPDTVTIDYVLHSADKIQHSLVLSNSSFSFGGAYDFLTDVQTGQFGSDLSFVFQGPNGDAVINVTGEPDTQVFLAKAPGYPQTSTHDVLILRRQVKRTIFAITVTEQGSSLDGFEVEVDDQITDPALMLKVAGAGQKRLPFFL